MICISVNKPFIIVLGGEETFKGDQCPWTNEITGNDTIKFQKLKFIRSLLSDRFYHIICTFEVNVDYAQWGSSIWRSNSDVIKQMMREWEIFPLTIRDNTFCFFYFITRHQHKIKQATKNPCRFNFGFIR